MALSSLTYTPPVRRSARPPKLDYALLETAATLAQEGQFKQSLTKVLGHLFPGVPVPDDLTKEPFSIVQGSSRVSTRIEGDDLVIAVPLVRLPTGGGAVAAMRYLLTSVSSTGQLHQPRLRGDDVYLEFREKLSRLHPAKVLEVLRRMPFEADGRDDFLIGQFSALPLERVPSQPLTPEEIAQCEQIWTSHWNEMDELLKEAQKKRSIFFLNEVTALANFRVKASLPLSGFLASRLNEAAGTFNDSDEDPLKREASLGKCIKQMKAVSLDELRKNLGHVEYAISPLKEGTPSFLSNFFHGNGYLETVDKLRGTGKPLDANVALVSSYIYLLALYSWPEALEAELKNGLQLAAGKPFREAADALYSHCEQLLEKYGDEEEEEEAEGEESEEGES
jgi:hypothetical protein